MREYIIEEVAKDISESYYYVLITAFEEQKDKFPITMSIIDFLEILKVKGVACGLGDIFIDTFIDKMYREANKYIGE